MEMMGILGDSSRSQPVHRTGDSGREGLQPGWERGHWLKALRVFLEKGCFYPGNHSILEGIKLSSF